MRWSLTSKNKGGVPKICKHRAKVILILSKKLKDPTNNFTRIDSKDGFSASHQEATSIGKFIKKYNSTTEHKKR